MKKMTYILIAIFTAIIGSCGSENVFKPVDKEAQVLVEEGWEKFSYRGYQNALLKFQEAITKDDTYSEAYCGAGWASARIPNLQTASNYFSQCLSLDIYYADAYAGLAFVYNAGKAYQNSISSAQYTLELNSKWAFDHDSSLDYKDLYLIMAEDYFALGDLSSSLAQVKLLDPTFDANVDSFEGKQALAEKIERLRSIV